MSGELKSKETFELCSAEMVESMIQEAGAVKRRAPRRIVVREIVSEPYQQAPSGRRCNCGTCAFCLENERWNRIFDQKFADPDYYRRPLMRHDSPLR